MLLKSRIKYFLLNKLPYIFSKYAPSYKNSYSYYWSADSGKEYRKKTYLRQDKNGSMPLVANPTIVEIRKELDKYYPESVLEIGCGWGRLLSELDPFYHIDGCDISEEYLINCPPKIKVFKCDIVKQAPAGYWDVVFTRAVIQYLINDKEAL